MNHFKISSVIGAVIFGAIVFYSCKKSKLEPDQKVESNCDTAFYIPCSEYFPMTLGSYWIYEGYLSDSIGNTVKTGVRDSIYVKGYSVIKERTYATLASKDKNSLLRFFRTNAKEVHVRDSSGFLVNELGKIIFTTRMTSQVLSTLPEPVSIDGLGKLDITSVVKSSQPKLFDGKMLETIDVVDILTIIPDSTGVPTIFNEEIRGNYAKGVGVVYYENNYLGPLFNGFNYFFRLKSHEIKN